MDKNLNISISILLFLKKILKNIDIAKKMLRKYWYRKENDRKILISIREFCKILILMKYCIDKILAYRTPLEI